MEVTEKKVNVIECCHKFFLMVKELHHRGFEKLRIIPHISNTGMYWRCFLAPKQMISKHNGAHWGRSVRAWDYPLFFPAEGFMFHTSDREYIRYSEWEKLSIRAMADLFQRDFSDMLDICKGEDKEYVEWYADMLQIIGNNEVPVAYDNGDDDFSYLYWESRGLRTVGEKIPIPPVGDAE